MPSPQVPAIFSGSSRINITLDPYAERYADDAICHCKSADEAQALWSALADCFAGCELVLHQKTKIVYCKDANRRGGLS
jgi:retron-type reverse transcriptase